MADLSRVTLHRCADAEVLADALAELLAGAGAPADPFTPIVVTVEAPGTARWLLHRLTRRLGISAGIDTPPLPALVARIVDEAVGVDPDTDPWRPGRLAWRIAAVLDHPSADVAATGPARRFAAPGARRMWLAGHLATALLDACRRLPDTVAGWTAGHDAELPADLAWQPVLWRALHGPSAGGVPDPVARRRDAIDADRIGAATVAPLSIFAPGLPSPGEVEVVAAVARHRPVHVWLPGGPRHDRPPLDATLGRAGRAVEARWRTIAGAVVDHPVLDRPAPEVSLHACHGPDRQAEVLRDVICGLLADDPTLEPRDILVACADPGLFGVLEAAFADPVDPDIGHPARALPVRFADPDRRDHNTVLATLATVLRLGRGRATSGELLGLLAVPAVARTFGLDDDQVSRAGDLIDAAGVRWGMNAQHRQAFGLGEVAANTWLAGLNRLLVGIALSEDGSYAVRTGFPVDDIGSSDIAVVGAVGELMARLIRIARCAADDQPLSDWVTLCRDAIAWTMTASADDDWQFEHAEQVLADLAAAGPPDAPPIGVDDLLDLLADALAGRVPRSAFRSGAITVCSLVPARHVPYRVVCVAGLDDGMLPRPEAPDGDRLADRRPDPGEPGRRHLERQLFLDAIDAARDHLVLLWTGADPRTGEERPPAVVVSELLDVLRADEPAGSDPVIRHTLQPHAPANFSDPPVSFDRAAAAAARALVAAPGPVPAPKADVDDLPPWDWSDGVVPLEVVVDVLTHPARAFLRRRAGFTMWRPDRTDRDALPLTCGPLEEWAAGTRVLTAALRGDELSRALTAEILRGTLPPGAAGRRIAGRIGDTVEVVLRDSAAVRAQPIRTHHVTVPLTGSGLTLVGDVTTRGPDLVDIRYGRISPRHRLESWLRLLTLAAGRPGTGWRATMFGRRGTCRLASPGAGAAELLDGLVGLATTGLSHPLPLPAGTGAALAASVRPGTGPGELAQHRALRSAWDRDRDNNWTWLWGEDLAALVDAERPTSVTAYGDEPTWLADLARWLWSPLLAAEVA